MSVGTRIPSLGVAVPGIAEDMGALRRAETGAERASSATGTGGSTGEVAASDDIIGADSGMGGGKSSGGFSSKGPPKVSAGGAASGASASASSSLPSAGDVGDGTSVGTGMSGSGVFGAESTNAALSIDLSGTSALPGGGKEGTSPKVDGSFGTGTAGASSAGSASVEATEGSSTGGSTSPSWPSAGDVGKGCSVGTGISDGDRGRCDDDITELAKADDPPAIPGMGMSCSSAGIPGSAGDVGEGMSVGTGISVGDGKANALSSISSADLLSASICGISVGDFAGSAARGSEGSRSVTCARAVAAVSRAAKMGSSAVGSSRVRVGTDGCSLGRGIKVGTLIVASTVASTVASPSGDVGVGNSVGTATLGESMGALLSTKLDDIKAEDIRPEAGGGSSACPLATVGKLCTGCETVLVGWCSVMVFASSSAGEVGDGSSVGTGISVGECCRPLLVTICEDDMFSAEEIAMAEDITCGSSSGEGIGDSRPGDRAERTGGAPTVGTSTSSGSPSPIAAGEVGEGSSVGTGMSSGDERGAETLYPADMGAEASFGG